MTTRYDCLPENQRRLLPKLARLADLGFVLYGGTAIALQLGHRTSIDFDFFSDQTPDRAAIVEAVPILANAAVVQDEKHTWTLLVHASEPSERPVKISFFTDLHFGRVGRPTNADHSDVSIASLDDLLGHKLKVLLQRVEAKDYQDIAAMLRKGQALEKGIGAATALFPNLPPSEPLKALVYFGDGDLSALSQMDRETLIRHVDKFDKPFPMTILSRRLALSQSERP